MKRSNLLILAPFEIMPPHFGSSERIYNLVEQLNYDGRFSLFVLYTDYTQVRMPRQLPSQWEHTVITKVGPSQRWAQFLNPALIWQSLKIIRRKRIDLILCEHLWAGWHANFLHLLTGIPFILDEHNVEYIRFTRMNRRSARLIRWWEEITCRLAAAILTVSETDKNHLQQFGVTADKIAVVPNAIDMMQYRPNLDARIKVRSDLGLNMTQPMLLFFGKLDYQPNAEAIEIIFDQIMPRILAQRPDAHFVICGYNPPVTQYQHAQLHFAGFVPHIEDYINAADVILAPLTSGGGTKFKIIQTIACGKPVVTTSIGAEGIEMAGKWMHISDNWDNFAEHILAILTSLVILDQDSLTQFRYHYSWKQMRTLVTQVVEKYLSTDT